MKTMKRKEFLVPFIVALTFLLVGMVSANELAGNLRTEFNGVVLTHSTDVVANVDETVPLRVTFNALEDADDVRINVRMEGFRHDVFESSERFNILAGKTYTRLLHLDLPDFIRDRTKDVTLYVEVVSAVDRTEHTYKITLQRHSYDLSVLTVDYSSHVSAGEVVPVSVVVKNTGFTRLDDIYVVAMIPELGISSRGYAGDLVAVEDYIGYHDEKDAVNKVVYLRIPDNARAGVYDLVVNVHDFRRDSMTETVRPISVEKVETLRVVQTMKSKEIEAGRTAEYEFVVINTGSNTEVFDIGVVSTGNMQISAPSVVVVGPGQSQTVSVSATAPSDAKEGTRTFTISVNGEHMTFTAHVTEDDVLTTVSPPIVALTVVLVIIFVVLLAVLIILLSRKESRTEEVETSYY